MPLYEYVCDACGRRTEVIQPVKEKKLTVCADCGGHLTKLFSAPAIQFKGSGWYITDYARGKKDEGQGGKKEASESSGAEASDKSDKSEKSAKSETSQTADVGGKAAEKREGKKETRKKEASGKKTGD